MTLEQIVTYFQNFAGSHMQLHGFGYGEEVNLTIPEFPLYVNPTGYNITPVNYPILYVVPVERVISNTLLIYRFTCIVADRVQKDGRDRVHIESDTLQILLDLIADMEQQQTDFTLDKQISISPFINRFADLLIGNEANINLRQPFSFDACAIPTNS